MEGATTLEAAFDLLLGPLVEGGAGMGKVSDVNDHVGGGLSPPLYKCRLVYLNRHPVSSLYIQVDFYPDGLPTSPFPPDRPLDRRAG